MAVGSDDRWAGAALTTFVGLGPVRLAKLRTVYGNWSAAWEDGPDRWPDEVFHGANRSHVEGWFARWRKGIDVDLPQQLQAACDRYEITVLTEQDTAYPERLRMLAPVFKPPILFTRGNVDALSRPTVTIVGTRRATTSGIEMTEFIATGLAHAGVVVVSGLAFGIDRAAHNACLNAGGATVAVLAGGPERATPKAHQRIYDRMLASGAVVSEYPPGTVPDPGRFPARNRILAALGDATVVVEAPQRSGALITARYALDLDRPVFAVPASPKAITSRGCLELLREGAEPFIEIFDVLNAINLNTNFNAAETEHNAAVTSRPRLTETEAVVYSLLDMNGEVTVDKIIERTGLDPAPVLSALTALELKGLCVLRGSLVRAVRQYDA